MSISSNESSPLNDINPYQEYNNQKQIDILKEKLNMKLSALNGIKANGYQQADSKVQQIVANLIAF